MVAAKGILAVLATVFVVADCLFPFEKGEEIIRQIRMSVCEKKIEPCIQLVSSVTTITKVDSELRHVSDNIDRLCKTRKNAVVCLRPFVDECPENSRDYKQLLLSAAYICSTEGRALLVKARHSSCYKKNGQLHVSNEMTMKCFFSSPVEGSQCQIAQRLIKCLGPAATQLCGEDVAKLFLEKYRRAYPSCTL